MANYYSLEAYKDLWKSEVSAPRRLNPLTAVVRNWSSVRKAFHARNRLIHGRDRYTATPHVDALIEGATYIDSYCTSLGFPLYGRLPIRRKRGCSPCSAIIGPDSL